MHFVLFRTGRVSDRLTHWHTGHIHARPHGNYRHLFEHVRARTTGIAVFANDPTVA
jgi:hypothetical protein